MTDQPFTAPEIEERLDEHLDAVLSSRRTAAAPAEALTAFGRGEQDAILRWVGIIAKTNAELAYQFASHAPQATARLGADGLEAWIVRALDVYDREGLYPGCAVLQNVDVFAEEQAAQARGLAFEDVSGVLERFVTGLSGRRLRLQPGDDIHTDTEALYVPLRLSVFAEREDNFQLYKAIVGQLWAQTWFGTFRIDLRRALAPYDDPDKAASLFAALETVRLDACIERELTGLAREMRRLQGQCDSEEYPAQWAAHIERLRRPQASVTDTLDVLAALYEVDRPLPRRCYQGVVLLDRVGEAMRARQAREKGEFRRMLARLAHDLDEADRERAAGQREFGLRRSPDAEPGDEQAVELTLDGKPIAPPEEATALMSSIIQDFGEIPPDYLVPAGDGAYSAESSAERRAEDVWKGTYHEEGAFLYNEWDHRRQHYRKNWCVLRELDVHPGQAAYVADTLRRYAGVAANLRRTFEALRGEDRVLKRQLNGDNVDLDALVEALADARAGREMSERVFTRQHKLERNIAVMFMVDMSGSTKGWINDAEREALVLLCEALEVLGDRYAIYGFSGMTRKRCELYRVKRFDEPYSELVMARIAGIRPQDYTRMGVTIRHLSRLLGEVEARTKLLVTLSDGKPDDYDGYRGEYGIEDTRQALIEAKRDGIHAFCITIDTEARDYLPHMYGAVNWALVDDVRRLPLKVSDIYRRLTS
jgi:nitric oxide reductase NorD protein